MQTNVSCVHGEVMPFLGCFYVDLLSSAPCVPFVILALLKLSFGSRYTSFLSSPYVTVTFRRAVRHRANVCVCVNFFFFF